MDIPLKCKCGAVEGVAINVSSKTGNHIICMCEDCQTFAHYLERPDEILDEHGGTQIFQLTPPQLQFTKGKENIKCVRLSPKGTLRWYTGCCNTPIANTLPSSKIAFAGTIIKIMDFSITEKSKEDILGPITKVHGKDAIVKMPSDAHKTAPFSLIIKVIKSIVMGYFLKKYRPSPFFDDEGKLTTEPYVVTLEERKALREKCGITG